MECSVILPKILGLFLVLWDKQRVVGDERISLCRL